MVTLIMELTNNVCYVEEPVLLVLTESVVIPVFPVPLPGIKPITVDVPTDISMTEMPNVLNVTLLVPPVKMPEVVKLVDLLPPLETSTAYALVSKDSSTMESMTNVEPVCPFVENVVTLLLVILVYLLIPQELELPVEPLMDSSMMEKMNNWLNVPKDVLPVPMPYLVEDAELLLLLPELELYVNVWKLVPLKPEPTTVESVTQNVPLVKDLLIVVLLVSTKPETLLPVTVSE